MEIFAILLEIKTRTNLLKLCIAGGKIISYAHAQQHDYR